MALCLKYNVTLIAGKFPHRTAGDESIILDSCAIWKCDRQRDYHHLCSYFLSKSIVYFFIICSSFLFSGYLDSFIFFLFLCVFYFSLYLFMALYYHITVPLTVKYDRLTNSDSIIGKMISKHGRNHYTFIFQSVFSVG